MLVVDAPGIEPARGGLLAVANIITQDGDRAGYEGITYEEPPRDPALERPTPLNLSGPNDWDRTATVTGSSFGIYRAFEANLRNRGDLAEMATSTFTAGESYRVEALLQPVMNTAATDITPTPGTAISPQYAVGLLEQHAAANYGGRPTLHTNRMGATVLGSRGLLIEQEEPLVTVQRSLVANGGGYGAAGPGAISAGASEFWIYMTGQVNLWQGSIEAVPVSEVSLNQARVLIQRTYVPVIDGFVAAVLASSL